MFEVWGSFFHNFQIVPSVAVGSLFSHKYTSVLAKNLSSFLCRCFESPGSPFELHPSPLVFVLQILAALVCLIHGLSLLSLVRPTGLCLGSLSLQPGISLHAVNWKIIGLTSFVLLYSQTFVLSCLFSGVKSIWAISYMLTKFLYTYVRRVSLFLSMRVILIYHGRNMAYQKIHIVFITE